MAREPEPPALVWDHALRSLDALAADPDTTREDLRQLGRSVWLALTGEEFAAPPGSPLPWERLDAVGITPDLGALPVLLARTLGDEPTTAPALRDTLKMLASLRSAVPVWADDMPTSRAPDSGPAAAPPPEGRPPVPEDTELWTRTPAQLVVPNRRRQHAADVWYALVLLVAGGLGGFFGGMLYEKTHGPGVPSAGPPATRAVPSVAAAATPADVPLPPSPPVGSAAVAARVQRVKNLQPEVGDILKYAREMRRIATVPVSEGFPAETQVQRVMERFDWRQPGSPNIHRTPLLLVLGYANDAHASQACADALAQAITQSGVTSPVYACGMGSEPVAEVEKAGVGAEGRFVEVWVAFTLF